MSTPAAAPAADPYALNARLREELAAFDEQYLSLVEPSNMSITEENVFLASLLAWEEAPALPIAQWFDSPLELPSPESLSDSDLRRQLTDVLAKLSSVGVVVAFENTVSERDLYHIIRNRILVCVEKRVATRGFHGMVRFVDQDVENHHSVEMTFDARPPSRDTGSDSRAA